MFWNIHFARVLLFETTVFMAPMQAYMFLSRLDRYTVTNGPGWLGLYLSTWGRSKIARSTVIAAPYSDFPKPSLPVRSHFPCKRPCHNTKTHGATSDMFLFYDSSRPTINHRAIMKSLMYDYLMTRPLLPRNHCVFVRRYILACSRLQTSFLQ